VKIVTRRRVIAAITALVVAGGTLAVSAGVGQAGEDHHETWVGTWTTSLTEASLGNTSGSLTGFNNQSVRQIIRTSVGGDTLRVRLTDEYGTTPLSVGHVTVALPTAPASPNLVAGSVRTLTFNGSQSATVYPGADLLSDPLHFDVPALANLVVTMYFPTATGATSWHWQARETSYVYSGDQTTNLSGANPTATPTSFFFLAGVDVQTRDTDESVVVLGDSISDGFGSVVDTDTRWPDFLATRLQSKAAKKHVAGVLDESLSGNAVNHAGTDVGFPAIGHNGLARLDHDVYADTAVKTVIVELGINDIQANGDPADKIIAGLRQLGQQLRQRGYTAIIATLGPFEGYPSWTAAKETTRQSVNAYIRGNHDFDAVMDLDAALRDPAAPSHVRADLDSGDHIHPNAAGAQVLADAVPLDRL
jgi:lysophospholipase L1-like esterase